MNQKLLSFAKQLRSNASDAEKLIWRHLRAKRFAGYKFKRQKSIGPYIVDFACLGKHLVIRFWNNEVLGNIEGVLSEIERILRV